MLKVYTLEQPEEWDEVVKSFQNHDIYYLSGYIKTFAELEQGKAWLFYYEEYGIRGINAVIVRDIAEDSNFKDLIVSNTYYDMISPYGYGGFLLEGDVTEEKQMLLDKEYNAYCRREGIVSEFVRFHPINQNGDMLKRLYDIVDIGNTVTMKLASKKQIWNDLTCKNRNMIRKARKSGVTIYWGRSNDLMDEFLPMYQATMDRNQAKHYYYFNKDFYYSLLEDIKYHALIFYAVWQENIIAMSILLFCNHRMSYHLSASYRDYQSLAPTNLLLYEAACYGCENGCQTFHLGGGVGGMEDSLYQFKKSFNRNEDTRFQIGKKIFDLERYEELVRLRGEKEKKAADGCFFPEYRRP